MARPTDYTEDTVDIYGLYDPRDGGLKYIGKANDANSRYKSHMRDRLRRSHTPVYSWMNELADDGKKPEMKILETCGKENWTNREIALISQHKPPLNVAKGGNQPHCPKSVRASNGAKNAKAIHSDPLKKHMWKIKRDLGQSLKQGHVTEATKVKIRKAAKDYPEIWGSFANI